MRIFIFIVMALVMVRAPLSAQLPTITNQPASRALWAGGNVIFAVGVSNAGAFTYQWQLNSTNLPNNIITTVAGNGINGHSGDGGPAINADFFGTVDVALDSAGNFLIADYEDGFIRKVDTNGIVTTVAGTGVFNTFGNNVPATNADLSFPQGVALDSAGNFYIADSGYGFIREVDTNGIMKIVAGNNSFVYSGDGGPATNAGLNRPVGVALDVCGNFFIADSEENRVRKVDTNGIITTVAGNGAPSFSGDGGLATNASLWEPASVAVDRCGNLFIADFINNRIRKVSTDGSITTVAGSGQSGYPFNQYGGDGGPATNAGLSTPYGVAVDAVGNIFIASEGSDRIRKVDTNGIITTVAGNGTSGFSGDGGVATNASLQLPTRVTVDAFGNLFISDSGNNRVRKVTNTQGPTLALNNVTATNAGSYQLVVTGPDGSVTSSVVNLIVTTTPLIYQIARNPDGSVALNFLSQPSSTNVVLYTTNLLPPIMWQAVSTNLAGPDGNWQFTDSSTVGYGTRFYRSLQR